MMGLSDGRKSFQIGLAVLMQYRSVTASHPASQTRCRSKYRAYAQVKLIIKNINTQSFTGRMPFLSSNQQCQDTEWSKYLIPQTSSPQAQLSNLS